MNKINLGGAQYAFAWEVLSREELPWEVKKPFLVPAFTAMFREHPAYAAAHARMKAVAEEMQFKGYQGAQWGYTEELSFTEKGPTLTFSFPHAEDNGWIGELRINADFEGFAFFRVEVFKDTRWSGFLERGFDCFGWPGPKYIRENETLG